MGISLPFFFSQHNDLSTEAEQCSMFGVNPSLLNGIWPEGGLLPSSPVAVYSSSSSSSSSSSKGTTLCRKQAAAMCVLGSTKPVKLRGFGETNKYGVAAKDLQELVKKGCNLLKVRLSLYLFIFHSGYKTSVRDQQPTGLNLHLNPLVASQKPLKGARVCTYDDGTELTDEYFKTLPHNVELVLLSGDEEWNGCKVTQ